MDVTNDNFTFIIIGKYITGEGQEKLITDFESTNPCSRVFDEKKFYLNIADHFLVPKHKLYRESYKELIEKLMISDLSKLPTIMHHDAMARHLNFREGDVVEIERVTLGKKLLHYRYCVDENYSFKKFDSNILQKRKKQSKKMLKSVVEETIEQTKTSKKEESTKEEEKTEEKDTSKEVEDVKTSSKEPEERVEVSDRQPWDKNCVMFYSKSKPLKIGNKKINLRYLSNFHKINVEGGIEIEGNRYSTIEHFFQAKKYEDKYQKGKVAKLKLVKFQFGNEYDQPNAKIQDYNWGKLAKDKGNKKYMNLQKTPT